MDTFTITQVCINKIHHIKILHLAVEINQTFIESLVEINASMSIMATNVVREFGIMHLVLGHEMYKTMSRIITRTLGRIVDILVTNCKMVCQMIFLVVDIDNYDLSLGNLHQKIPRVEYPPLFQRRSQVMGIFGCNKTFVKQREDAQFDMHACAE